MTSLAYSMAMSANIARRREPALLIRMSTVPNVRTTSAVIARPPSGVVTLLARRRLARPQRRSAKARQLIRELRHEIAPAIIDETVDQFIDDSARHFWFFLNRLVLKYFMTNALCLV